MKRTRTRERAVDEIVAAIGRRFCTFGGGRDSDMNPLAHALKDHALTFAAGVDVRAVVEFVLDREDEEPSTVGAVDPHVHLPESRQRATESLSSLTVAAEARAPEEKA